MTVLSHPVPLQSTRKPALQYEWNGTQVMDEVHQRISQDMQAMARQVVQIAERYAPKQTGRLATGLGFDWNDATLTVVFTAAAPYSIFVEYGTRYMVPQPYFRPALNTVGPIFGINTEFAFLNTPHINQPLLADGAKFHGPKTLTARQKEHIRRHLVPTSQRHFIGNVSRTRMHPRRQHY